MEVHDFDQGIPRIWCFRSSKALQMSTGIYRIWPSGRHFDTGGCFNGLVWMIWAQLDGIRELEKKTICGKLPQELWFPIYSYIFLYIPIYSYIFLYDNYDNILLIQRCMSLVLRSPEKFLHQSQTIHWFKELPLLFDSSIFGQTGPATSCNKGQQTCAYCCSRVQ